MLVWNLQYTIYKDTNFYKFNPRINKQSEGWKQLGLFSTSQHKVFPIRLHVLFIQIWGTGVQAQFLIALFSDKLV